MTTNMSFVNLVLNASLIVQLVMLSLVIASIASWSIIFSKNKLIKKIKLASDEFESAFWKGGSLSDLYQALKEIIACMMESQVSLMQVFRYLIAYQAINQSTRIR